jgi:hypothetical protein
MAIIITFPDVGFVLYLKRARNDPRAVKKNTGQIGAGSFKIEFAFSFRAGLAILDYSRAEVDAATRKWPMKL